MQLDDFKTVEEIMEISFKIPYDTPIKVYWPNIKRKRTYQTHHQSSLDCSYNINKDICIIRMPERAYVTPISPEWEGILERSELRKRKMFVPFSNGDYPVEYSAFWDALIEEVTKPREF